MFEAEKLNAIADKYELRLHTGGRTIKRILWESLVTESFLAGSSTEDGFLYEDSSFRYKGSIELAGYGRVEFAFVYTVKGSFQEVLQALTERIDFDTLWGIHMSELGASSTSGDRISLSGYQESPEAKALAEWQAFCAGYDTDGKILSALGNGVFVAEGREDWSLYGGGRERAAEWTGGRLTAECRSRGRNAIAAGG